MAISTHETRKTVLKPKKNRERLVSDINAAVAERQPRALRVAAARKVVRSAAAAHDGFVTLSNAKAMHEHCRSLVPDAQLQTVPGGHTSGHALARWLLARVICESVDRLAQVADEAPTQRSRL